MNAIALLAGLACVFAGVAGLLGGHALVATIRFIAGAALAIFAGILALAVGVLVALEHVHITNWLALDYVRATPTLLILVGVVAIVASYQRRREERQSASPLPINARSTGIDRLSSPVPRPAVDDAISALRNLGYSKTDASAAVAVVLDRLASDVDVQMIIKAALKGRRDR